MFIFKEISHIFTFFLQLCNTQNQNDTFQNTFSKYKPDGFCSFAIKLYILINNEIMKGSNLHFFADQFLTAQLPWWVLWLIRGLARLDGSCWVQEKIHSTSGSLLYNTSPTHQHQL